MDDPDKHRLQQLDEYILDYIYSCPITNESELKQKFGLFGPAKIKLIQKIKSESIFEKITTAEIINRSNKQISIFS
jgi:hypothetical protein